MAEEEMTQEAPAEEVPLEERLVPGVTTAATLEHDAVLPNGECSSCGWKFGNPEPHPVFFGAMRQEPVPEVAPAPINPPPAPDPNACAPIMLTQTCEKCGWNTDPKNPKSREPHPVLAH